PPGVDEVALLGQLVALHRELDAVAEALLDAGDDDIGPARELLEQVGLVEPRRADGPGLVRDARDGARAPAAGARVLRLPDDAAPCTDLVEGQTRDLLQLAVVAVLAREGVEQVMPGQDAELRQARLLRLPDARDGGDGRLEQVFVLGARGPHPGPRPRGAWRP